jgi:hypothetical protein
LYCFLLRIKLSLIQYIALSFEFNCLLQIYLLLRIYIPRVPLYAFQTYSKNAAIRKSFSLITCRINSLADTAFPSPKHQPLKPLSVLGVQMSQFFSSAQ